MLFSRFKRFRIVMNSSPFLPWTIEERYTMLFFIHWWDTPSFMPPHYFETMEDAIAYLRELGASDKQIYI